MTIQTKIVALAQAIGADMKALRVAQGDLSTLPTTAKGNLVTAIKEIYGLMGASGALIDDNAGDGASGVTWSANKIFDTIELAKSAVKSDLIGGAGAALDTFKELQDALGNDPSFAATVATSLTNRLRFDDVQTLTSAQKLQACNNLGIGDPDHDFAADYTAAKA